MYIMKPNLTKELSTEEFNEYYYLKEELIDFCHNEGLKSTGNRTDLESRICQYLENNKHNNIAGKKSSILSDISLKNNFEYHLSSNNRKFFEDCKDSGFNFNVNNNIWFKNHPNTKYEDVFKSIEEIRKVLSKIVNN